MNPILDLVIGAAGQALDRLLPDPAAAAEAKLELGRLAQAGELAEIEADLERARIGIENSRVEIEAERVHQEDRDSARGREAKTGDTVTTRALAFVIVGMFSMALIGVFFFEVPEGALAITYLLFGALITSNTQILNYYFGSSMGSANKERMIQRSIEQQQGGEIRRIPTRL